VPSTGGFGAAITVASRSEELDVSLSELEVAHFVCAGSWFFLGGLGGVGTDGSAAFACATLVS